MIITKDVFSTGLNVDIYDALSGSIELYENNLVGTGHRLTIPAELLTLGVSRIGSECVTHALVAIDSVSCVWFLCGIQGVPRREEDNFSIEEFLGFLPQHEERIGLEPDSNAVLRELRSI